MEPEVEFQPKQGPSRGTDSLEMLSSHRVEVHRPTAKDLQEQGVGIVLKDVEYKVKNRSNSKEQLSLLQGVTGFMQPAEMTALMGPSGSGKTTLLDLLAGRKTQGNVTGEILFRGQKPSLSFLRRYTGYVEQFDTLLGTLTVREMLLYTAELKRPVDEPYESKSRVVDDVINKLALTVCKDTVIGSALSRGVSGGQAKRTNIGIALVTNPRVLFLDEPTTGLDSYTSNDVMNVVKGILQDGVTICATIHSPTQFAFRLFDNIMMLVRGQVVYFGPNDQTAIKYFESLPGVEPYDVGENEAEWITDIVTSADRQGLGPTFAETYATSDMCQSMDRKLTHIEETRTEITPEMKATLSIKRATTTPFFFALKTMFKYRSTKNFRDPEFLGPRLGDKVIVAIILFSLYWGIGNDYGEGNAENVVNIAAILFMWNALPAFGAAAYVPAIALERSLYVRERSDGLYRSITYLVFKMTEELTVGVIASLLFAVVVFFAVQLQGSFFIFWLGYFISLCVGIMLAYFVAAISPNMDVANAALPAYGVTLIFFSGFLITFRDIPDYWIWWSYLDFLRYAQSALMINQFEDNDPIFINTTIAGTNQTRSWTVTEYYDVKELSIGTNLGIEACFFVFFGLCAWLTLTYKKFSSR
eukprot:TRINITY_DN2402_c0_g1_i2.p1 TRINITY_DN2402_c0_g1~~TRINITY_DN2402_c0_g1_i2.p1  ORF type:complete len:652 (-),score=93.43 TRINITY_DN2402_c0_g1_i2:504-2429(-)